ncbi:MAG: hypothetical protein IJR02_03185 [Bacteroidaceae bacterium]|nr:hypothetical protein [Bacteroidaceae bacterium]
MFVAQVLLSSIPVSNTHRSQYPAFKPTHIVPKRSSVSTVHVRQCPAETSANVRLNPCPVSS